MAYKAKEGKNLHIGLECIRFALVGWTPYLDTWCTK